MLNLTKQQAITEHRKMWNWIADETKKCGRKVSKEEYFIAMDIAFENRPETYCYCCDYVNGACIKCPIEWGGGCYRGCCDKDAMFDDKGLYAQWANADNPEKAAQLAREIAKLPERK